MYETCHHVMPSGLRCQSPAMRGASFCYFHGRRATTPKANPAETRIQLPATLDRKGIPQALREVMNALANNQISARRASILLYGLQMAVTNPEVPSPAPAQSDPAQFDQVDLARLSSEIAAMLGPKNAGSRPCPNWHGHNECTK